MAAWLLHATAQPHLDRTFVPEQDMGWKSAGQSQSHMELFGFKTLSELDVRLNEMGIFKLLRPYEIAAEDPDFMSRRESWEQNVALELAAAKRSLTRALALALKNVTNGTHIVDQGILFESAINRTKALLLPANRRSRTNWQGQSQTCQQVR